MTATGAGWTGLTSVQPQREKIMKLYRSQKAQKAWEVITTCNMFVLILLHVLRFWDEGQPDNWDYMENGEDCGQLHASAQRKRKLWNDADCNLLYRYICEKRV